MLSGGDGGDGVSKIVVQHWQGALRKPGEPHFLFLIEICIEIIVNSLLL